MMFTQRSPIQNIRNRFHQIQQELRLHRSHNQDANNQQSSSSSSACPSPSATDTTTGFITAIDGIRYKITIPGTNSSEEMPTIQVQPVPSFDEMIRSYRSKPQCLTLNEIDDLFPLLTYGQIFPILQDRGEKDSNDADNNTMDQYSCMVCLAQLEPEAQVRLLPCNHLFHNSCIVSWVLHNNGNCPLCKRNFRNERVSSSCGAQNSPSSS